MIKRNLADLKPVYQVGMGCMGFSHGYGKTPIQQYAIEAIRYAYQNGCTFFDTAEIYGSENFYFGHNEKIVGEALKPIRKNVCIATKLMISTDEYLQENNLYNLVLKHLKQSLKNLQTDYIDLYYLHRINEDIDVTEVAIVMKQLIQQGYIKGWGLSQVGIDTIKKAHNVCPLSVVQNLYSIVERECEKEVIPYCLENNIYFVAFGPVASGFLSGKVNENTQFVGDDFRKYVPQLQKGNILANQPILEILKEYANNKKATLAQISLSWMINKYENVIPIPGSKNQERIIENLNGANVKLDDVEFNKLNNQLDNIKVYGHRGFEESFQNMFIKKCKENENKNK